jgi:hypothetical protein
MCFGAAAAPEESEDEDDDDMDEDAAEKGESTAVPDAVDCPELSHVSGSSARPTAKQPNRRSTSSLPPPPPHLLSPRTAARSRTAAFRRAHRARVRHRHESGAPRHRAVRRRRRQGLPVATVRRQTAARAGRPHRLRDHRGLQLRWRVRGHGSLRRHGERPEPS